MTVLLHCVGSGRAVENWGKDLFSCSGFQDFSALDPKPKNYIIDGFWSTAFLQTSQLGPDIKGSESPPNKRSIMNMWFLLFVLSRLRDLAPAPSLALAPALAVTLALALALTPAPAPAFALAPALALTPALALALLIGPTPYSLNCPKPPSPGEEEVDREAAPETLITLHLLHASGRSLPMSVDTKNTINEVT